MNNQVIENSHQIEMKTQASLFTKLNSCEVHVSDRLKNIRTVAECSWSLFKINI